MKSEFSLSNDEKGVISCCQTMLHRNNTQLYERVVNCAEICGRKYSYPDDEKRSFIDGAAIMYQ